MGESIKIAPIIVGCMSYGDKRWAQWVLEDEEKIFQILKRCYDVGLRTFDTADVYSNGKSEELIGKFIKNLIFLVIELLFYPKFSSPLILKLLDFHWQQEIISQF